MRKVIISLAPVSGSKPINVETLAEDVKKSVEAGAAMCHLHSRTYQGELTKDPFVMIESFERIRDKTDIIIQASTGGISEMTIQERCNPLEYAEVESASLNGGSTNLGEAIYRNSFSDISYCANIVFEKGIIPEIEVFDIGMINNIQIVKEKCSFREPILFNLVFGHQGGMQATIDSLFAFRSFVPREALWGITHFGRDNWTFLSAAIAMGASLVRIGFEDSYYMSDDFIAEYNYQLVEKLAKIIKIMGLKVATPNEARQILHITNK